MGYFQIKYDSRVVFAIIEALQDWPLEKNVVSVIERTSVRKWAHSA